MDLILKILTVYSAGSPKKITNCITLVNFWAGYIPVAGIPAIKKNNEDIKIFLNKKLGMVSGPFTATYCNIIKKIITGTNGLTMPKK